MTRSHFLKSVIAFIFLKPPVHHRITTVTGQISKRQLGRTLIHEHCLVDFIGADKITFDRWDRNKVVDKILPYLIELRGKGIQSIMDCTPAYIGRDVILLKMLSEKSGLHILTNTGYYGAVNYKYLPSFAYTETPEQLATRWVDEAISGIEKTGIKPGFIKIGVNGGQLSELETKLITAAGMTHLQTGLTICSHTGPAVAALGQLKVLKTIKVKPEAFIWTHAQNEINKSYYTELARMGAWVSLDGIAWGKIEDYADWLVQLKYNDCLHRVLISHDAGWYDPAKEYGGTIKGYTRISDELIPILEHRGFKSRHIDQLLIHNPAEAFNIHVRKYN